MPKILLVEDNDFNRDMILRRLKKRNFEIIEAVTGIEAIGLARSEKPDLIIMDLNLPELDGWSVTLQLKGFKATRDIPIIALTAHAMPEERQRAIEAGVDDFDTKPLDFKRLLHKIENQLSK